MTQLDASTSDFPHHRTATPGLLYRMVYRSRAVNPLSKTELQRLTRAAQSRNKAEAVTGLVVYHEQSFFQWLEGPADSLERIMQSIRNDSRHTDVQMLHDQPAEVRRFGSWTMKLATPTRGNAPWRQEVIDPPRDVLAGLHDQPDDAPSLLLRMVPLARTATILQDVCLTAVLPELLARHELRRAMARDSSDVVRLVQMVLDGDTETAGTFIAAVANGRPIPALYGSLVEPAARRLGDLWAEDTCSEAEVTLGLCGIQTAVRRSDASDTVPVFVEAPPAVLVVPAPGEPHALGATIGADVLWRAGWAPRCEYPANDTALQDVLASTCFDAVDLSLSPAFTREHALPLLTETIASARQASRNPSLVVVVSGRLFRAHPEAVEQAGADSVRNDAQDAPAAVWRGLKPQYGQGRLN